MRFVSLAVLAPIALAACAPQPMTLKQAMAYCQEKADAAAGVHGNVGLSLGTGGTSASLSLSVSDSYLRGDDPKIVYDTCMNNLSANGQITGE